MSEESNKIDSDKTATCSWELGTFFPNGGYHTPYKIKPCT